MENSEDEWEQIGVIGVDAGVCWIGDPCYILQNSNEEKAKELGATWKEFVRILGEKEQASPRGNTSQFNYDKGHPGLGVCVESGYGDGMYPVLARFNEEGRVASVRVDFIGDSAADEEDWDEESPLDTLLEATQVIGDGTPAD